MPLEIKETGFGLDLEGPLVNLESEGHHQAYLDAAASVGVHLTFEEALRDLPNLIGGGGLLIATQIYNLSDKLVAPEEIELRKQQRYQEWLTGIKVIPTRIGLFDFLEEAKKRGLNMMIATATEPDLAIYYIRMSGLKEFFDEDKRNIVMAIPGSGIRTKPAPDIYFESARRMGIDPRNQLIVEDSVRGITAGVTSGGLVFGLPVYNHERAITPLRKAGAIEVYREWPEVDINYLLSDAFRDKKL